MSVSWLIFFSWSFSLSSDTVTYKSMKVIYGIQIMYNVQYVSKLFPALSQSETKMCAFVSSLTKAKNHLKHCSILKSIYMTRVWPKVEKKVTFFFVNLIKGIQANTYNTMTMIQQPWRRWKYCRRYHFVYFHYS